MAAFAKPTTQGQPSPASLLIPPNAQIAGVPVGEDVAIMDAVYIKNDGMAWRSNGTSANAAAKVRGYAWEPAKVAMKQVITIVFGVEVGWANAGTPGADLFLSASVPGGLDTAASTGGSAPVGFIIDANRVFLFASRY